MSNNRKDEIKNVKKHVVRKQKEKEDSDIKYILDQDDDASIDFDIQEMKRNNRFFD